MLGPSLAWPTGSDTLCPEAVKKGISRYHCSPEVLRCLSPALVAMVAVRLNLGKVSLTKSVRDECKVYPGWSAFVRFLLIRHSRGDWGDLSEEEKEENDRAFKQRVKMGRLLSAYSVPGGDICIITDNPFDDPSTLVFHCSEPQNHYPLTWEETPLR